jgi:hypothetical protein
VTAASMEHYLTLHPRFGIEQIWPQGGDSRYFGPGGEAIIPIVVEISPELMPVAGCVPVVDTLMVFASLKKHIAAPIGVGQYPSNGCNRVERRVLGI